MPTGQSIAKDFHDLQKNIKSYFDEEVTITKEYDRFGTFQVTISPKKGYFKGGEFIFEIVMDYDPPKIFCKTPIYHPNINTITSYMGEVCINLTSDSRMRFIVEALVYLMYNPNFGDPLCEVVSSLGFDEDVKKSIAGQRVGDYVFPVNPLYARLHPPGNDEEKRTEEHVEGLVLIEKHFGIKQYVESTPDDDDDDDDGDDDDDDDADDDGGLCNKTSSEEDY